MARKIVSRPPPRQAHAPDVRGIRVTLFEATAVVNVIQHAVTTGDTGLSETDMTFALKVASRLIDSAAAALEPLEQGGAS